MDLSSYVDPNGFIFWSSGQLYRAINNDVAPFYEELIRSGYIEKLISENHLIDTEISDYKNDNLNNNLILKHRIIEPLNYCVEWSPLMLKDAALLTVELCIELLEKNCMLQDAYPWNIVFDGANPIFVDFTSIVPVNHRLIWPAYNQFQSFFLWPLELSALNKGRLVRALLSDNINGIGLHEFILHLTFWYKIKPTIIILGLIDKYLQKNIKNKIKIKNYLNETSSYISNDIRCKFLTKLHKKIESIELNSYDDEWRNYYESISGEISSPDKLNTIENILEKIRPKTVLDLGANTGVFSLLAAEKGAKVISIDASEACIDNLYKTAKDKGLSITTIISNILCPTPSFGYLAIQYPSLIQRIKSEMLLCLGLMHHLHITGLQSFDRITDILSELTTKYLVFEYIDINDSNIHLINSSREINYNLEKVISSLSKKYKNITIFNSDRETRKILLCERKSV